MARSPGVAVRTLPASQSDRREYVLALAAIAADQAESVGFEPTVTITRHSGFQDRRPRPLGELSADHDSGAGAWPVYYAVSNAGRLTSV
jgi:hypothetical protein